MKCLKTQQEHCVIKPVCVLQFKQILKDNGLADAKISWRKVSGENVFHKMWYQKSDASNAFCKKTTT